jgi:hypothetical protein
MVLARWDPFNGLRQMQENMNRELLSNLVELPSSPSLIKPLPLPLPEAAGVAALRL